MLEKVNLLKQSDSSPEEGFTIDAIISRTTLDSTPLSINLIMVKPGMETVPHKTGGNRHMLYFFSGAGRITTGHNSEEVISGDRVTISSNHDYIIANENVEPLHALQIVF